jgi:putative hydrolase of the HAD superfamily
MALRALLVDVGNTLLSERPSRFELYAVQARARGVAIDAAGMQALMRQAHRELPREIGGAWRYTDRWFEAYVRQIFHTHLGLERAELPRLSEELFGQFSRPETFVLYPGAHELLARARALGLRIGIVSNWSARLPRLLEQLALAPAVDFVLCSAVERLEKPDPAIFARALELARVQAHEALHAGDDLEHDVLGARRAGLHAVLVDHAGRGAEHAAGYAPRVTSLDALARIVEQLAR